MSLHENFIANARARCAPSRDGVTREIDELDGSTFTASRLPARPTTCEIEMLTPTSRVPRERSHYIAIGTVWLVGGEVSDPGVQDNVRRRACGLGGDAAMLVGRSHTFRSGGMATYLVLSSAAAHAAAAPSRRDDR